MARLTADFEKATADKVRCQKEADATQATIQLANRLVGGLASENVRWAEAVAEYVLHYLPVHRTHIILISYLLVLFADLWRRAPPYPATHCSSPPSFRMSAASPNNSVWI